MTDNWLSDCHQAPVKVVGADEGTNHWECTQCGKACNAHQTDNTIKHIHISKVGDTHCLECGQQLPQSTIDEQGASATPDKAKQPSVSKPITYVEVRVYEGDKLMELRRHPITYAFPNSTDQIFIAPKVLRAGEYPHDDQVTLFGFNVEIEAALQHIKVSDLQPSDVPSQDKGHSEAQS